jgi:hypothetical protein
MAPKLGVIATIGLILFLLACKSAPPPVYAPYVISETSAQAQADGQQYGLNITITTKSS